MLPRLITTLAKLLLGTTLLCGAAQAATITASFSWDFDLTSGGDFLGLDNASGMLVVTYDTTQTYLDRFALPAVDSLTDALTVSGASATGTNGSYAEADGVAFYPTSTNGVYFSGGITPGDIQARWDINGITLEMQNGLVASATNAVSVGDAVDISHFGTSSATAVFLTGDGSAYSVLNFNGVVSVVPVPAAVWLFGSGLLGLVGMARRKKSA